MPDILSILNASLILTKVWTSLSDKPAYPSTKPRWFSASTLEVADIVSLHLCLLELAHQTKSCIIRGRFIGENAQRTERQKIYFADQPLHSVMIEIDNHTTDSYLDNPVVAINAYIHAHLPECFHEVSYSWSLSSSAGHPTAAGKLKAHVWFWLTTPYTSAQMRAWAKNNAVPLDRAVFDPIQIHFTADPLFENNLEDPVKTRRGLYRGLLGDEVALNLDIASLGAVAREAVKREAFSSEDPLLDWLFNKNMVKDVTTKGYAVIECPFASEHTTGVGDDTSTTYMPAGTEGYARGHFSCLHGHCTDRADADFDNAIGYTAEQFEALPTEDPATEMTVPNKFTFYDLLEVANRPRLKWIIKNILPKAELGVLFGESTAGKSFVALDMMMSIARGVAWNGFKTVQGQIAYVCAEGSGGLRNRIKAYAQQYDLTDENLSKIPLITLPDTPNFMDPKDTSAVALAINQKGGASVIFVDTLAQTTPGANENSGEDMGKAIAHCRKLARLTGAVVVLIHHAGKDLTKGARGWSGVRAAADFEIEVSREGNARKLRISKQKDGEDGAEYGFRLNVLNVDMDEDETIITSCVVEYVAVARKAERPVLRLRDHEQEIIAKIDADLSGCVRVRDLF